MEAREVVRRMEVWVSKKWIEGKVGVVKRGRERC